jgi:hypothetical protein
MERVSCEEYDLELLQARSYPRKKGFQVSANASVGKPAKVGKRRMFPDGRMQQLPRNLHLLLLYAGSSLCLTLS